MFIQPPNSHACTTERHHALFTGGKCMHREMPLRAHSHTARQNLNPNPLGLDPSCPPAFSDHCEGSSNRQLHYSKRTKTLQHNRVLVPPPSPAPSSVDARMRTRTRTVLVTRNGRELPFKAAYDTLRVFSTPATRFLPQPAQHPEGLLHRKDRVRVR